MTTLLHLFILSSFVFWSSSSAQKSDGHPTEVSTPTLLPQDEVQALEELLDRLGDRTTTVNSSFCVRKEKNWTVGPINLFVSCSCIFGDTCHILEINASSSGIPISRASRTIGSSGSSTSSNTYIIPESVAKMRFLKTLVLSNMGFQSYIPSSLGNLSHLECLNLSMNQLIGSIPFTIGDLHSLQKLDLSANYLTKGIPSTIGDLRSLQILNLYTNLLQGDIPTLRNLVHLTSLDLSENNLTGPIPDALGNQLLMLQYMDLSVNRLDGPLPEALGNLTKLTNIDVGSNFLTGEIPKTLDQLAFISYFGVYGNNMSGKIPSFTNWTRLSYLELLGNNFEGPLPDDIFMKGNLILLDASDLNLRNGYYYRFPPVNFTSMQYLILRNCSISGEIPFDFGKFTSLFYLDLSFNNLSGALPSSLNKLSLDFIILDNNNLEGEIPKLKSKSRVRDFSFNKFTMQRVTKFKDQYENFFNCCTTEDNSNMVSSQDLITKQFCKKSKESTSLHINCGGNEQMVNGMHYQKDNSESMFHTSDNWAYSCNGESTGDFKKNLSCGIGFSDTTLFATARVCPVSLKYYGLCFRNGKYDVTLHFAEIEYNKKQDYSSLENRIFDVYIQSKLKLKDYNIVRDAGGPDKGVSRKFPGVDVENHVLEVHLYWAGKGSWDASGVLISGISVSPYKSGLSPLEIAMIAIACIVFLGLLVPAIAWQMGWIGKKSIYEKRIDIRGTKVSIKQLTKATQNFNPKKEIGKGGFGSVYKAELAGQVIAVKKLSPRSKQGVDEFRRELYTLKSLRHKNLVELLDGYSDHGYHLLIYEYMENKSLADVLFDPNLKQKINWQVRHKICKDIAAGLKFLHEETHLRIVHGDIKATNILLDGAHNAKISDFGLANVYVEDDPSTVVKIGGTTGYMAPEYATQGIMTHKADVYSFGVVLLEIISGKKNAQYKQRQESEFLLDTAYVLHKNGRTIELVDPDLRECLYEKESYHQVKSIIFLAMMCTSLSHSLRPTMSEVVSVLEGEKTIEQVSNDHPIVPTSASHPMIGSSNESSITQKNWIPSDVSSTSTDVSSFTTTTYFIIKDKDEKKDSVLPSSTLEISDDSATN